MSRYLQLAVAAAGVILSLSVLSCQRQDAHRSRPEAMISRLVCSGDGSTVCLSVISGTSARLVRLRPGLEPKEIALESNSLLATEKAVVSADGGTAYFTTMPYPRPPYQQSLVALDLQTGAQRNLANFDVRRYFMTRPEIVLPDGRIVCARTGIDGDPQNPLSKESADFVSVDQRGVVTSLTPRLSPETWKNLPQSPHILGYQSPDLVVGIGPKIIAWRLGNVAGPAAEAPVLWRMPRHPYSTARGADGTLAAIVPDDDSSPTAGMKGTQRLLVADQGTTTEAARGHLASVLTFSPDAKRLAFVDLGKGRLQVYNVSLRRLQPGTLPSSIVKNIQQAQWLANDAIAIATGEASYLYHLDGRLEQWYRVGRNAGR